MRRGALDTLDGVNLARRRVADGLVGLASCPAPVGAPSSASSYSLMRHVGSWPVPCSSRKTLPAWRCGHGKPSDLSAMSPSSTSRPNFEIRCAGSGAGPRRTGGPPAADRPGLLLPAWPPPAVLRGDERIPADESDRETAAAAGDDADACCSTTLAEDATSSSGRPYLRPCGSVGSVTWWMWSRSEPSGT